MKKGIGIAWKKHIWNCGMEETFYNIPMRKCACPFRCLSKNCAYFSFCLLSSHAYQHVLPTRFHYPHISIGIKSLDVIQRQIFCFPCAKLFKSNKTKMSFSPGCCWHRKLMKDTKEFNCDEKKEGDPHTNTQTHGGAATM